MLGRQVCSVCNESMGERDFVESIHGQYQCGTWEQLIAEVERLHRLHPENMETSVRALLQWEAGYIRAGQGVKCTQCGYVFLYMTNFHRHPCPPPPDYNFGEP